MAVFNLTKFCDLAGHYEDLSSEYRITFLIIFAILGVLIIVGNTAVLLTVIQNQSFHKRQNTFLTSLMLTDLFYGFTFIPLFVVELSSIDIARQCSIRSWRVITFTYFLSTRLLSIFFISLQTYIKTCKSKTKIDRTFHKYTHVLNIVIVWLLTLFAILTVGLSRIETGAVLGILTLCYMLVSIIGIVVCYVIVLLTIKRAKQRYENPTYKEATNFIRMILIWFLTTTIPLMICGLILVVFAHRAVREEVEEYMEHQIYIACLAIASVDALANPIVYFRKLKELREEIDTVCQVFCYCKTRTSSDVLVYDGPSATPIAVQKYGKDNPYPEILYKDQPSGLENKVFTLENI